MAKVSSEDEDLLYDGDWLEIRAMSRRNGDLPAKTWADGLDKKGKAQLMAAATVIETTLRSGRPPAGRAEKVVGSACGLWELKVTKPGSTPPHLRLLYLRDGQTLWAAVGFTKQKNKLAQSDIDAGGAVAREWLEAEAR
jgi:hypothetical protein